MAVLATALPKKNINDLHIELGHPSETITHDTAKALGIQVIVIFKPCKDCALGKAKQYTVSKKAVTHSKILRERHFFHISYPLTPTFVDKWHWLLIVENSSSYIWSFFLKEKSDLVDAMVGLIQSFKNKYNFQVRFLHFSNAGENQAFEWTCKQEGLGVNFKYTAPSIPQWNGCIEWKFATLFNRVHTMLNSGNFTAYLKNGLWAKAAYTNMLLENNIVTSNRNLSQFQQFLGREKEVS